jgi:hypothetical protein
VFILAPSLVDDASIHALNDQEAKLSPLELMAAEATSC